MCVVYACVSEGQLNLGVSGAKRPGSPGQGVPVTVADIARASELRQEAHAILKGRVASTRYPALPPTRLALNNAWEPEATSAKVVLPLLQTCKPQDIHL